MRGRGRGKCWRTKKYKRNPVPQTLPPPVFIPTYTACCFCKKGEDPELGTFFQNIDANLAAHQFCLLFSCGLPQAGADQDGFEGFLFPDIFKEVKRVRKIVCKFCLGYGASSGCFVRSCPFTYHYKCGLENDAQFDFHGTFNTHCYAHRSFQDTSYLLNGSYIAACPICLDDVDGHNLSIIKMPCCINVFAHKECVQNQAKASGYFFRCPTCKNEKEFKREMARFGIYIPQRDASWEENNAFSDLLQQYQSCDLPNCKCPMGQNFEEEHGKWELVRCYHCGQGAVHRHCLGKRYISVYGYVCRDCDQVTGLLKGFTFSPRKSKEQTLEQKRLIQEGIAKGDPLVSQILLTPKTIAKRFDIKPCRVEITRLPDAFLLQLQENEDSWIPSSMLKNYGFMEFEDADYLDLDVYLGEPNEMDELFFGNDYSSVTGDESDDDIPLTIFQRRKVKGKSKGRKKMSRKYKLSKGICASISNSQLKELDENNSHSKKLEASTACEEPETLSAFSAVDITYEVPNELDEIYFGDSTASDDSDSDFMV